MTLKFKIEYVKKTIPRDARIEELKYWCHTFQSLNLTPLYENRSLGNLSFRLNDYDDSFIVTASALALKDDLSDDSFVLVHSYDFKRGILYASGMKEPSSESMLHFGVYSRRKDTNAIFHGHSGKILYSADSLNLPTTKQFEDYGSSELVESVFDVLDDEPFVVMKNHGFLSLGKNMEEAGKQAVRIYEQAQLLKKKNV